MAFAKLETVTIDFIRFLRTTVHTFSLDIHFRHFFRPALSPLTFSTFNFRPFLKLWSALWRCGKKESYFVPSLILHILHISTLFNILIHSHCHPAAPWTISRKLPHRQPSLSNPLANMACKSPLLQVGFSLHVSPLCAYPWYP